MKLSAIYSHLNGFEWIQFHQKEMWDEIEEVITNIEADEYRTKIKKEKTKRGKMLFSRSDLNDRIKKEFEQKLFPELTEKTATRPNNQTTFVKNRIAIEVQFGYSFSPFDLFSKHLAFYVGDTIDVGIEVLPMKVMQAEMSSGPGYYEGALYDLARQGRGVPAVPLVLIGIEP